MGVTDGEKRKWAVKNGCKKGEGFITALFG
jgi:hypothetical protein